MTNQLSFSVSHVSEQNGKKMNNVIKWNLYSTMIKFISSTVKCNRIIIFKQKCTVSCLKVINRLQWLISFICLNFPLTAHGPVDCMTVYVGSHLVQLSAPSMILPSFTTNINTIITIVRCIANNTNIIFFIYFLAKICIVSDQLVIIT